MNSPLSPRRPIHGSASPSSGHLSATNRSRDLNAVISSPEMRTQLRPSYSKASDWKGYETHHLTDSQNRDPEGWSPPINTSYVSMFNPRELGPAPRLQPARDQHHTNGTVPPPPGPYIYAAASRPTTGVSTPTPKEQDAVESLLFMSSPANSASHGRGPNGMSTTTNSAQVSPTRAAFAKPRSRNSNAPQWSKAATRQSPSGSSEDDANRIVPSHDHYTRPKLNTNIYPAQSMDGLLNETKEHGILSRDTSAARSLHSRSSGQDDSGFNTGIRRA